MLANPSSELQEGRDVTREMLRERGIRPYDEKVILSQAVSPNHRKSSASSLWTSLCSWQK